MYIIQMLTLLFSCILIFKLYPIVTDLLHFTPHYKDVTNRHRYITKNVIKASVLVLVLLYTSTIRDWSDERIPTVAGIYVSNDIVGLMCVPNLHLSTKIHHAMSIVLLVYAFVADFKTSNTAQMLYYYTYFSAATFYVNLYLGLRFCYILPKVVPKICFTGYGITLALSLYYQYTLASVESWPYLCILVAIVYDDLVLLRWLYTCM